MATRKKITISSDSLTEIDESQVDFINDISLICNLKSELMTLSCDLRPFLTEDVNVRKGLKKFIDFLTMSRQSIASKRALFYGFTKFLKEQGSEAILNNNEEFSLRDFSKKLNLLVLNKKFSRQSYISLRWQLKAIFVECFNFDVDKFILAFPEPSVRSGKLENHLILDANGKNKGFTKEQFKELTKMFVHYYNFLNNLPIENKDKSFIFKYRDIYECESFHKYSSERQIKNKATFCLVVAFIALTGLNLSPLLRLKRSDILLDKNNGNVSFKVICNRKNKEQNHNYPVKGNQIVFFEKLLDNSVRISPDKDILFPYLKIDNVDYFSVGNLISYYKIINKGFIGDFIGLNITSRKLRHTFGCQFDDLDSRSVALFNSIGTSAKNYSTGNADENNQNLQSAMNIYTIALTQNEDIENVKQNINKIKVVKIEDLQKLKSENSQITSSGVFCVNSKEGIEAEKFKRRITSLNLTELESIHCANILACFNCKHSVLVNDFDNVYLLKSFYDYLNNVIYQANTSSLFSDKNAVKSAIVAIEIVFKTKISKDLLTRVNVHIDKFGIHPIWDISGDFI